MKGPLISIIIPTYNRKNIISTAIDSCLQQIYQNTEIIIIDDGSIDGSFEFLKNKYGKKIRIWQIKHQGVSSARNIAINKSRGEWLAFLDSDDFFHKDKLSKQISLINENPNYKICHSEEIWIKDGVRINPHKKHKKISENIFFRSIELCSISISTVLIKKEIFAELGNFDETIPACEDYDLWLRVTAKYPVLLHHENLTTKFGGHKDQLSKKHWGMDRFRIYALDKIYKSNINQEQKNLVKKILLKKLKIFIKGAKKHNNLEYLTKYQNMLANYESIRKLK